MNEAVGRLILGVDIGGTHFRIGAVNEKGRLSQFQRVPTREVLSTGDVLADLTRFLRVYSMDMETAGIAIGFPATMDRERQQVLQAPNLPSMERLPVVATLSNVLGVPVFVERDVTMALCFDTMKYHIPPEGIVCGIYFGTGIGNAIQINGAPLIGKNGVAGELGHIPADGSTQPCGCGNAGCIENLAGGKYLACLQRERFSDTPIGKLFVNHGSEEVLQRFIDRMAITVATEINILDPDHVLIGGGVPAMEGFPRETLTRRIFTHTRKPYPAEKLEIIYTDDEPEKSVIGAALYAKERMR